MTCVTPRASRLYALLAALLMALLVVVACAPAEEPDPVTVTVRMGEAEGRFYFAQGETADAGEGTADGETVIEAPGDAPIVFELVNEGTVPHTFTVDAVGIHVDVAAGTTVTTNPFSIADGSYVAYCAVPGHRQAGQEATLKVGAE